VVLLAAITVAVDRETIEWLLMGFLVLGTLLAITATLLLYLDRE